jgi:hypothetical protein
MKNKKLGGCMFIMDGVKHDYPFTEAIKCLEAFCDIVSVCVVVTEDGTAELVRSIAGPNTNVIFYELDTWESISTKGKERLSVFTNKAISSLKERGCTHVFSLQADEILHEDCYELVRALVDADENYNYHCQRLNMWGGPNRHLVNPKNGQPCSTVVCRLAKLPAMAYGDAESIMSIEEYPVNEKSVPYIRIYHMGFIRDPYIHPGKIKNMQEKVFNMDSDPKLIGMDKFEPWKWHDINDTEFILENLPLLIQYWAHLRNY